MFLAHPLLFAALTIGGHSIGRAHGNGDPSNLGREPAAAEIHEQGFGWNQENGTGANQITSGLEGAWTTNPDKWDHQYLDLLLNYKWESKKSPAGAWQWGCGFFIGSQEFSAPAKCGPLGRCDFLNVCKL